MVKRQLCPDPHIKHAEILKKKRKKVWIPLSRKIRTLLIETTSKSTIEANRMMITRNHRKIQIMMIPMKRNMKMTKIIQMSPKIINKINKLMNKN